MADSLPQVITIVGGGASGALLAIQLIRQSQGPLVVKIVEPRDKVGLGVAYSPVNEAWVLNVPAGKMSALPEVPDHFLQWLNQPASVTSESRYSATDFVPRRLYGEYLHQLFQSTVLQNKQVTVEVIQDRLVDCLSGDQFVEVIAESGQRWITHRVVLALGNFPPQDPFAEISGISQSPHYISNPWLQSPILKNPEEDVLILGGGLTAVDTVLRLKQEFRPGMITLISRRGLIPKGHSLGNPFSLPPTALQGRKNLRALTRSIRRLIAEAEDQGYDWRAVLDSLRPFHGEFWQNLNELDQKRFLRHVRPYWEVHRHRLAPEVWNRFNRFLISGEIQIMAGRLVELIEKDNRISVQIRRKGSSGLETLSVGLVINCLGPDGNFRRFKDLLVVRLIESGLIRPHPLRLGLHATAEGALLGANFEKSDRFFSLGPPLKGVLWESTAIPEIRSQAKQLAQLLLNLKLV